MVDLCWNFDYFIHDCHIVDYRADVHHFQEKKN